jgi:hypothetical protein
VYYLVMKVMVTLGVPHLVFIACLMVGYVVMLCEVAFSTSSSTSEAVSELKISPAGVSSNNNALLLAQKQIHDLSLKLSEAEVSIRSLHEQQQRDGSSSKDENKIIVKEVIKEVEVPSSSVAKPIRVAYTQGVIVLGMHRSGTSMLGGLMNKMGLAVGGPLIRPFSDNEKGFFERIDVVLQNDYIMKKQRVHYALDMWRYNHTRGINDVI